MSYASDHPAEVFQLFPALEPATESALRSSIERHGVLVPIFRDQHGRTLDGYHRSRIADELSVPYGVTVIDVRDDAHANEIARTLNMDRRHLEPDQRRQVVADLRRQGHSLRAIGGALGVSEGTVRNDLGSDQLRSATQLPDRIIGRDGKSRPATRPAREIRPGDVVADGYGEARLIDHVETFGEEEIALVDDRDEFIPVHVDDEVDLADEPSPPPAPQLEVARPPVEQSGPPITKPDLGGGVSHPARYSSALLPIFQDAVPVEQYPRVLDPFAGTGRIHELDNETVGVELEPEWANMHPDTIVGSALDLEFDDESFDAVVTSPTYGNRLADSHDAADPHLRRSYTHDLGRKLSPDNSGGMQWGPAYRDFHEKAWEEAWRVIRPGGRLVLNIKDHVRRGRRAPVTQSHIETLFRLGFGWAEGHTIETANLRQGENAELRFAEQVLVFEKPEAR